MVPLVVVIPIAGAPAATLRVKFWPETFEKRTVGVVARAATQSRLQFAVAEIVPAADKFRELSAKTHCAGYP